MATGLPVISSDCGGMREVIEHNVNGLLFENRNIGDLIHQLETLLNKTASELEQLTMAARQTVEKRFGANRMVREMEMLYRAALKDHCNREN